MSSTMKARKTTVLRYPYWVPSDDDGRGAWRFLPADYAHTAELHEYDQETGDPVRSRNPYAAKGWIVVHDMDGDDPRRDLLPTNWKRFGRGDDKRPVFSEETIALMEKRRPKVAK